MVPRVTLLVVLSIALFGSQCQSAYYEDEYHLCRGKFATAIEQVCANYDGIYDPGKKPLESN